MTDTVKIAVITAAVIAFFVGTFILAAKLFGPKKTAASGKRKKPSRKAAKSAAQAVQPAIYNAPKAALPDVRSFGHLTPGAADMSQASQPAPIQMPQPAQMQVPQPVQMQVPQPVPMQLPQHRAGKISYGSATEYVSADMVGAARGNMPAPAKAAGGKETSRAALRITICGDNGTPEYFVNVDENELPVTIGRGKSDARGKCIEVSEPTVSFQQAKISVRNGVLSVCDCCSTCGTIINAEGCDSLVLKNESKNSRTELYLNRFEMVMGRMRARVEVLEPYASGLHIGCRITLSAQFNGMPVRRESFFGSFSIGRSDADFVVPDPLVSRLHAVVNRTPDGRFLLRDNHSTNGIYEARSDRQITEIELKKGTSFIMGDTGFTVENVERGLPSDRIPSNLPKTVFFDSVSEAQSPRFV